MNILKTLNEAAGVALNEFKAVLTGKDQPLSFHDEGFTAEGLAAGVASREQRIANQMSAEYHARKATQHPGQG